MKVYISGFLILALGVAWAAAAQEQIRLVEEGSTNYRIMLGPSASPTEEFAVQELQGYVMQISGAFLPLDRGITRPGKYILVGNDAITRLGLNVDESYLGPDGFVIKNAGDIIILAGGSPRGTLYSVYAFLEMLGCRWLAPGIIGEVIPQMSSIVISPIEHLERPGLMYRGFTNLIPVVREGAQWIDWMAKNRMNYLMVRLSNYGDFRKILGGEIEKRGMYLGVSFDSFTSVDNQSLPYEIKPETVASSEALQKMIDEMLNFIADNPEVDIIELTLETLGDQYVQLLAEIKKAVQEEYPDSSIRMMARDKTAPDVGHSILDAGSPVPGAKNPVSRACYRHSIGDERCEINKEFRTYLESCLKVWGAAYIYEYYMGSYSQNSLPFPILNTIASDMGYFDRLEGLDGVISQCEPENWGTYGLNYYVFARTAWNNDADLGNIVDDYCEKYYGSASEPMKKYFSKLEDAMSAMEHFHFIDPPQLILKLLNEDLLADLDLDVRNAEGLAKDAMSFDRIRKTQLSLEHTKLLWHTLNDYFKAIQLQETREGAKEYYQKAADTGERLVAFLFHNLEEGVFIIPESYIFDYLEAIISDARRWTIDDGQ